jgi:hypothetical protein
MRNDGAVRYHLTFQHTTLINEEILEAHVDSGGPGGDDVLLGKCPKCHQPPGNRSLGIKDKSD